MNKNKEFGSKKSLKMRARSKHFFCCWYLPACECLFLTQLKLSTHI